MTWRLSRPYTSARCVASDGSSSSLEKLHQDHLANQAAIHGQLAKIQELVAPGGLAGGGPHIEE